MKVFPLGILILSSACSNIQTEEKIVDATIPKVNMNKLLGDWIFMNQGDTGIESWVRINDTTFEGSSISIKGNDTGVDEHIELYRQNDAWQYCALVSEQNEGNRICFKLRETDTNSMEFINYLHDFPQMIVYRFVRSDSVVATVSGKIKGQSKSFSIELKRVNAVSDMP